MKTNLTYVRSFCGAKGLASVEYGIDEYVSGGKGDPSQTVALSGGIAVNTCFGKKISFELEWNDSDPNEWDDDDDSEMLLTVQRYLNAFMTNWSYEMKNRGAKDPFEG